MHDRSETHQSLSDILTALADHEEPQISVAQMVERFGGRALGGLLLIFGLACSLPLPPGGTTIFGAPLLLLAPQLVIGARHPWLPAKVRRGSVATADLKKGLPRILPWVRRVEAVSRPRFGFLFGGVGERVIGVTCTLLAAILILPIPLGNMLPAAAVSVLSLALIQRDGLLALFGYALTAASFGVLVLAGSLLTHGFHQLLGLFSHA